MLVLPRGFRLSGSPTHGYTLKGSKVVTGFGTPNFGRLKDLALSGTMKREDSMDWEKGSKKRWFQ